MGEVVHRVLRGALGDIRVLVAAPSRSMQVAANPQMQPTSEAVSSSWHHSLARWDVSFLRVACS
jgi:hypothetical protein